MKLFYSLAIALLLLPVLAVAQDSPEDRYIPIFDLIQDADKLADAANLREATPKYKEAQEALLKLQKDYPDWNTKIVKFRLTYLASKLNAVEPVSASAPVVTLKPANGGTSTANAQVQALQNQLRQVQTEKADLEKQLQQVSASSGSSRIESQALAEAENKVKELLKENEKLKDTIEKQPSEARNQAALVERATQALTDARAKLAEQTKLVSTLTEQNDTLQKRLEVVSTDTSGTAQITNLQKELRQAEAERLELQSQLKDAESRTASAADQISRAEGRIKNLQKENNLLRASLEQRPGQTLATGDSFAAEQNRQAIADLNARLDEQAEQIARLTREKADLQKQLREAVNSDALAKELAATKNNLKKLQRKYDIQTEAAVVVISEYKMKVRQQGKAAEAMTRQLEEYKKQLAARDNSEVVNKLRDENDSLKQQIAKLQDEVASKPAAEPSEDLLAVQVKVAALQSQLDVLMAKAIPYTEEELALMKPTASALAAAGSSAPGARGLPGNATELVAEAQRLFAARKLDEAEAKYEQVLKLAPNNVFALANLATIQIELEDFVSAEKNLRKAMSLDPKDAFTLGVYGNMLFRLAKYDDALEVLSRAAQLDPNSAEIQNILGITLSHKGQRGAAETALRKALQLDPNYGNAHNNLAVIYITQDPPLTELAKWHYQKALSLGVARNPDLEKLLDSGPVAEQK